MTQVSESYPATVTANNDPEQRGRIRVACLGLMGDEETELPMWVEMVPQWGWFSIPDVGEIVEVVATTASIEDEQHGQTSIDNLNIKWRGERYFGNIDGPAPTPIPDDFKTNYGKRRGFCTPAGHIMLFDDTDTKRKFSVTWKGDKKDDYSYMAFDEDGSFIVGNKNGSMIYLNAKDKEMALIDEHGNSITGHEKGLKWIDKQGNIISSDDKMIQIISQKDVKIQAAGTVDVEAAAVHLNGNSDKAILGDKFMELFNSHIHPTGMGPSGPVPNGGAFTATLSSKVKLGT